MSYLRIESTVPAIKELKLYRKPKKLLQGKLVRVYDTFLFQELPTELGPGKIYYPSAPPGLVLTSRGGWQQKDLMDCLVKLKAITSDEAIQHLNNLKQQAQADEASDRWHDIRRMVADIGRDNVHKLVDSVPCQEEELEPHD